MSKFIKYLGIDWGEKRIGLALGDSETRIATPLGSVSSIEDILEIVKQEEIDELVIGLPLSLSGEIYRFPANFKNFLNNLKKHGLILHLTDERFSSREADVRIGKKLKKFNRDAVAAMIILQSYLDKIYAD